MMRVADYLDATRRLPLITRSEMTRDKPFVVLSPHPDDETLGVGGLIYEACRSGQRVEVIVLTDGAGSHTQSRAYPPARLVQLRRTEVIAAADILGLASERLHHLDLPDAHAPAHGPDFDAAVSAVIAVLDGCSAGSLFVTWGEDPHCDHKAAAAIAEAAARKRPGLALWAYPIWGWHLDPGQDLTGAPSGGRLDIASAAGIKQRAIAAHRSQMTDLIADDPAGFRFTATTLAPFLTPFEYFYAVPVVDTHGSTQSV
jgi:LmbE family N-acetylglucosaminyl deacetylase